MESQESFLLVNSVSITGITIFIMLAKLVRVDGTFLLC